MSKRRDLTMSKKLVNEAPQNAADELFAEKMVKVTFRDFCDNTRMDIKNVYLKAQ